MTPEEKQFDKKWDSRYKERVENSHTSPSPETRERLKALEITQANIMEKLEELQQSSKESHNALLEAIQKLEAKVDNALEKKAGVWVEKVLYSIGGFIGFGFLSYLGKLIYDATIHIN
jgi:hypothetical protein